MVGACFDGVDQARRQVSAEILRNIKKYWEILGIYRPINNQWLISYRPLSISEISTIFQQNFPTFSSMVPIIPLNTRESKS